MHPLMLHGANNGTIGRQIERVILISSLLLLRINVNGKCPYISVPMPNIQVTLVTRNSKLVVLICKLASRSLLKMP